MSSDRHTMPQGHECILTLSHCSLLFLIHYSDCTGCIAGVGNIFHLGTKLVYFEASREKGIVSKMVKRFSIILTERNLKTHQNT